MSISVQPAAFEKTAKTKLATLVDRLNPEQRRAVMTTDGPVLVVAGAGTGKTTVLTARIAYLLEAGFAQPEEILAVTFTNKAAKEMRTRVEALVGPSAHRLTMGSFHGVSMSLLRHTPRAAGLKDSRFLVLDEDEQRALVEATMDRLGFIDPEHEEDEGSSGKAKKRRSKAWKDMVKEYHRSILHMKEDGVALRAAPAEMRRRNRPDADVVLSIWEGYQEDLLARNACDFADLLLHMVEQFRAEPDVRERWANRYRYVLVDEFQDTNDLQYEWLKALTSVYRNLTVVGDPDQSIYQWRNARPEIINNFATQWPGARTVVVDTNYRSTQEILDVANAVVEHNPRPVDKVLRSGRRGKPVACYQFFTADVEAMEIARDIDRRIAKGKSAREIAILYRGSAQMLVMEKALSQLRLPYEVVGGQKFYEREEVKDILAYMRLAIDPADDLAFARVANKPTRNVGDAARERVLQARRGGAPDMPAACRAVAGGGQRMMKKTREGLEACAALIEELAEEASAARTPGVLVDFILRRTDYVHWRKTMGDERLAEREENLLEIVNDANGYTDIATYLQSVATVAAADMEQGLEALRISTVHAAKGLEFDVVYTPALEMDILPNARALKEDWGLSEERRICHVAWTRARHELIVSCAARRGYMDNDPSPFLEEGGLEIEPRFHD